MRNQGETFNSGSGTAELIGNFYEEFGLTSITGTDNIWVVSEPLFFNWNWKSQMFDFFTWGKNKGDMMIHVMIQKIGFIFAVVATGSIVSILIAVAFGLAVSYA